MKGAHKLLRQQWIPGDLESVFAFFREPDNLEALTPPFLRFRVEAMNTDEIEQGSLIDYKLSLRGLPLRWRSEILDWNPPLEFVDKQLRGPYRYWHHRHSFQAQDGGVLVTDEIDYTVLSEARFLAPIENLVNALFVRRDVARIFAYRAERMGTFFPGAGPGVDPRAAQTASAPRSAPSV